MKKHRGIQVVIILLLICIFYVGTVTAEDSTSDAAGLEIHGEISWSIKSAIGDLEGLKGLSGYALNRILTDQQIKVETNYTNDEQKSFDIQANFDSSKSGGSQQFQVGVSSDNWKLAIGEYTAKSDNPLTMVPINITGANAIYTRGPLTLEAMIGRVEGEPAVKEFTGGEQQIIITYAESNEVDYSPIEKDGQILGSIWGMLGYTFTGHYDLDFFQVSLKWSDEEGGLSLQTTLEGYGLEYLLEGPDPVLDSDRLFLLEPHEYTVVSASDSNHLLLRRSLQHILQRHLFDIITEYNQEKGLVGSDAVRYPFIRGSAQEGYFFEALINHHLQVVINSVLDENLILLECKVTEGSTGRFYDLGHSDVVFGSVTAEIRLSGDWYPGTGIGGFSVEVFESQGIVDVTVPLGFEYEKDAIRFSYRTLSPTKIFPLGLSLSIGSEKVYVNGQLLMRNIHYLIDYESGILVLVDELGSEDKIRIEYQYDKGGLGRLAYYQQNLYYLKGLYAGEGIIDLLQLDVARLSDIPLPKEQSRFVPIMPRTHTMIGLGLKADIASVSIGGNIAFSEDIFPPYAADRPNEANEVNQVLIDDELGDKTIVLFGHNAGLTVAEVDLITEEVQWDNYFLQDGLSGMQVRDIAMTITDWWFATSRGITRVPRGLNTLDSMELWDHYNTNDGLPSDDVWSLFVSDSGVIYAGTSGGLAIGDGTGAWRELLPLVVSTMAKDPLETGVLYIGTDQSLHLLRLDGEVVLENTLILEDVDVKEIVYNPNPNPDGVRAWAATDQGLFEIFLNDSPQALVHPETSGQPIDAVSLWEDEVWYASNNTLYQLDTGYNLTLQGRISSIGSAPYGSFGADLWVGSAGDGEDLYLHCIPTDILLGDITTFLAAESGIPTLNPLAYLEPENRYIVKGFAQQLNATTSFGPVKITGGFSNQDAQFLPIGRDNLEDLRTWSVAGTLPWNNGAVKVEHSNVIRRNYLGDGLWDTDPHRKSTNQITLNWNPFLKFMSRYTSTVEWQDTSEHRQSSNTLYSEVSTGSLLSFSRFTVNHSITEKVDENKETSTESQIGAELLITPTKTTSFKASWIQKDKGKASFDMNLSWSPKWNNGNLYLSMYRMSRMTPNKDDDLIVRSRIGLSLSGRQQYKLLNNNFVMSSVVDINEGNLYSTLKQTNQQLRVSLKGSGSVFTPTLSGSIRINNTPSIEKKVLTWNWQSGLQYNLARFWSLSFNIRKEGQKIEQPQHGSLTKFKDGYGVVLGYEPQNTWNTTISFNNNTQQETNGKTKITRQIENTHNWTLTSLVACQFSILFGQEQDLGSSESSLYRVITLDSDIDLSGGWESGIEWVWKHGSTKGDSYSTHAFNLGVKRTF